MSPSVRLRLLAFEACAVAAFASAAKREPLAIIALADAVALLEMRCAANVMGPFLDAQSAVLALDPESIDLC